MTTEAHTEISRRLETVPADHARASADLIRSPDWDKPFLSLPPERQAALLAEVRTERDIEAMSAGMGMPTVAHRHYDWCIFADQGDNVLDCLSVETGAMECEGQQLSVPLTIEGQTPIVVMPTASHDVAGPYLWLGGLQRSDDDGDVWLTPQQATALGHYLLATAALIG